jgi:hypothetical protein
METNLTDNTKNKITIQIATDVERKITSDETT